MNLYSVGVVIKFTYIAMNTIYSYLLAFMIVLVYVTIVTWYSHRAW